MPDGTCLLHDSLYNRVALFGHIWGQWRVSQAYTSPGKDVRFSFLKNNAKPQLVHEWSSSYMVPSADSSIKREKVQCDQCENTEKSNHFLQHWIGILKLTPLGAPKTNTSQWSSVWPFSEGNDGCTINASFVSDTCIQWIDFSFLWKLTGIACCRRIGTLHLNKAFCLTQSGWYVLNHSRIKPWVLVSTFHQEMVGGGLLQISNLAAVTPPIFLVS